MITLSVLLADPQRLFREALAQALSDDDSLSVCRTRPSSGAELLAVVEASEADVVLVDSTIVDDDLVQQLRRRAPTVKMVVLSWLDQAEHLEAVLAAGVAGWLPKTCDVDTVIAAIRRAHAGESPVFPERLEQLLVDVQQRRATAEDLARRLAGITAREREVVEWLTVGATASEITQQLGITARTVQTHIRNLKRKTGARTQLEAARMLYSQATMPGP